MIELSVKNFLEKRCGKTGQPLLVALSGGPDSLALFYLLLKWRNFFSLNLHVAHINHNWRPESTQEADSLKTLIEGLHLPFHLKTLNPAAIQKGNLEAHCREERLNFFAELQNLYNYQAVLFGHQADDQAETVLKRVFEGVHLPYLGSIREVSSMGKLTLWRPLLSTPKKAILHWLKEHNLTPFYDKTNDDPHFLRARMRSSIIPELAKEFGKEISVNLSRLGEAAQELRDYLDDKIAPYLSSAQRGPFGVLYDLNTPTPIPLLELKHFLRVVAEKEKCPLSRSMIETLCHCIQEKTANHILTVKNQSITIDRGRLFLKDEGGY